MRYRVPKGRVALTKLVELFDGETDVVQDTFEETLFERSAGMEGHGDPAVVGCSSKRQVAATLVGRLESKPLQDGDELTGGQDRELLTAHGGR